MRRLELALIAAALGAADGNILALVLKQHSSALRALICQRKLP